MKEKHEIVYLKAERNSVCYDPQIKIKDVMSVECADAALLAGIISHRSRRAGKSVSRCFQFCVLFR